VKRDLDGGDILAYCGRADAVTLSVQKKP
jgi:hypothetical protein